MKKRQLKKKKGIEFAKSPKLRFRRNGNVSHDWMLYRQGDSFIAAILANAKYCEDGYYEYPVPYRFNKDRNMEYAYMIPKTRDWLLVQAFVQHKPLKRALSQFRIHGGEDASDTINSAIYRIKNFGENRYARCHRLQRTTRGAKIHRPPANAD